MSTGKPITRSKVVSGAPHNTPKMQKQIKPAAGRSDSAGMMAQSEKKAFKGTVKKLAKTVAAKSSGKNTQPVTPSKVAQTKPKIGQASGTFKPLAKMITKKARY